MPTRDQLTFERFEALCDLLAQQGVIPQEWRQALSDVETPEQGREARQAAREGSGPPEWAGTPTDAEGGPSGGE